MKPLIFLVFLLSTSFYLKEGQAQTTKTSIDSLIEKKMTEGGIVGVGAAVFVNKKLVWTNGYGYADLVNKLPFKSNTIMNVGSISKTITGLCLMHAVQDKQISLDEDVNNYLPFKVINPYFPNEKITIRNLATHTSGITDQQPLYNDSYCYGGDSPELLGDFLSNYFMPTGKYYKNENFLPYKPGMYFNYSNIATGLAGFILESVAKEKMNEYSKRFIFEPLKMDDTGWFLSEIQRSKHSNLYRKENNTFKPYQLYGFPTYPDGGVRTSVQDLSKFFVCLLNGGESDGVRILKRKWVDIMLSPYFTESTKPYNMILDKENIGFYWFIKDSGTRIGHEGRDPGVKTVMQYDPSKQIGVILFTNTELDSIGEEKYIEINSELWKYALTLKRNK